MLNGHISPNVNRHCLNTFNVIERMTRRATLRSAKFYEIKSRANS
jgi:hypothetical protein